MKKNLVLLFLVQISNYIFPLISMPYLIRVLGVESFGKISIFIAILHFINIVIDFGFSFTSTRSISVIKNDNKNISLIFSKTIYAKSLLLLIIGFVFGFLLLINNNIDYYKYYFLGLLFCFFSIFECIWLYQGIEKLGIFANISLVSKTLMFLSIFYFVKNESDFILAVVCSLMGAILCGLISIIYILKFNLAKFCKVRFSDILIWFKSSFNIFLANFFINFYTTLNVVFVGYFYGATVAGFFSAADKIRLAAQGLLMPVQQILFPKVTTFLSREKNYKYILKKYGIKVMLFGAFISIMLLILGYPFSLIYFGNDFELTGKMLLVLSPIPFIVSVGVVFGQWFLIGLGYDRKVRNVYIIFSFIHLLFLIPLILLFDNYGVVISILMTEFFISSTFVYFYLKNMEKKV